MGKDIYFWNFIVLDGVSHCLNLVPFSSKRFQEQKFPSAGPLYGLYLIVVGIVKGYGIAAYFMHLKDEHKWFNITFMFPWIFVALMLWGIGLSNPEGVTGLPSWCTPDWSYATER